MTGRLAAPPPLLLIYTLMPDRPPRIAIIDVGSNTIKLLVAEAGPLLRVLDSFTHETRISYGIGAGVPRLTDVGMHGGLSAIGDLLRRCARHEPDRTMIVATSAVRDAVNGEDFTAAVREATGLDVQVLSGKEEALGIAEGVLQDPAIARESAFSLCDLGGGSLELIRYEGGEVRRAESFPLGAVRLTERFVSDPTGSLPTEEREAIAAHVRDNLRSFPLEGSGDPLVCTGGAMTIARAMLAAEEDLDLEESSPQVPVEDLRGLFEELAARPLAERQKKKRLPPQRADIFPCALLVFLTVADLAGATFFVHTFSNLRYGLASRALAQLAKDA